jgi:hypothetical protein
MHVLVMKTVDAVGPPTRPARGRLVARGAVLAVAVAAVLAGGCGGQRHRSDLPRSPAAHGARNGETKRVRSSLIRLADVPPGWKRNTVPARSTCADAVTTDADATTTGISPVLSSEPSPAGMVAVHQSVALFADRQRAAAAYAKLSSPRATRCLASILVTALREHAIVRSPLRGAGTTHVTASSRQTNFRVDVRTAYGEGEAYVYVVEARRRRGVTALVAGSLFSPLSPSSLRAFTQLVLRRLAATAQ